MIPYWVNLVLLAVLLPPVALCVAPWGLVVFPGWREVRGWFGFR